jgi:hypothetical protein
VKRGSAALLGGITLLGALLRIWSPGRIGLWGDEVQFLGIASMRRAGDVVAFLAGHESHPPLTYLAAWALHDPPHRLAVTLSVLALMLSIAAVPAAWWLAARSGSTMACWLSAGLVAASVPVAFTNVQIRPYGLVSLLLLLSALAIVGDLQHPRWRWRLTWAACALLLLYAHHMAVLILAAELVVLVLAGMTGGAPREVFRRWAAVWVVVGVLGIPDLLLLRHQEALTGYLPSARALSFVPLRQFLRLTITFPGELLVPLALSVTGLIVAWQVRRRTAGRDARASVAAVVSGMFLVTCAAFLVAGVRQNVLSDHIVLPVAPLGQVAAGVTLALAWHTRRGLFAGLTLLAVVGMTLSALFTEGAVKTNIDLVARRIEADARPSDLVLVAPGVPGLSFNWYFRAGNAQINYPVAGPVRVYEFDDDFARVSDPVALQRATDSITAASEGRRRVWFVFPAAWDLARMPAPVMLPDSVGVRGANRQRAALLHRRLLAAFGLPGFRMRPASAPWSMELMALERFGS